MAWTDGCQTGRSDAPALAVRASRCPQYRAMLGCFAEGDAASTSHMFTFLYLAFCVLVISYNPNPSTSPTPSISSQCEYSARTIRGKINGLVPEYLVPFPNDGQVIPNDVTSRSGVAVMAGCAAIDWKGVLAGLTIDRTVDPHSLLTNAT